MIEGMSTTTLEQYPYVQDLRFQLYCTPVVWGQTLETISLFGDSHMV